jgi:isopentenyl diphosphate isomerase/L-lactate dehydrogenase-like FMN-dependent dehydrogenase
MRAANVEDLRQAARSRLPQIFFDYLDGGSYSETTLATNTADFSRWTLQPRVLADISRRDLSTTFLGRTHALPLLLGPVGFAGMLWHRGEILTAQAGAEAGIPSCVSSFSICALEDVAASVAGPLYYQLYVLRDRKLCEDMIRRAQLAGVETLFLTVDTVLTAARERDVRNGFRGATRLGPRQFADLMRHPRWCLGMARGGAPQIGNLRGYDMGRTLLEQASALAQQIDPVLTWGDLAWLRRQWSGRLVVKGIMHPDDARRAIDAGADAIVVSNHGGRQLDHAPSTITALPAVAAAVGQRTEIIFDGGVRRGSHVVKALALGATAVALGRAYAYGLAASGQKGVLEAIKMLREEMDVTLGLMGLTDIASLRVYGAEVVRERVVHAHTAASRPQQADTAAMPI